MKENIEGIPGPEHFWQPGMSPDYQPNYSSDVCREITPKVKRRRVQDLPRPAKKLDNVVTLSEGDQREVGLGNEWMQRYWNER